MMRKQLLTTVAAMAIATPALAADLSGNYSFIQDNAPSSNRVAAGDVELGLGGFWMDLSDLDQKNFLQFQGWARANVRLGSMWNIMPEAGGNAFFGGDLPDGISFSTYGGNLHLWGGDGFRYGVFGGATFGVFDEFTFGQVGAEAEADMGNATLGVQGFYSWHSDDCCIGDADLYGVNGWIDYYFAPNTKLTVQGLWVQLHDVFGEPDTIDLYGGGARLTQRFAGSPVNVFVEGDYWHGHDGGEGDFVNVLGGITLVLDGNGTQEDFDRKWAPFTFRNPMAELSILGPFIMH